MYCYFSLEYYDQENGIRGGGGLGVLAADTRRVADEMGVELTVITPFYPKEYHQVMRGEALIDEAYEMNYEKYDFKQVDYVFIRCNDELCKLQILEKKFDTSRILAVTEPNFGSLYQDTSGSDHRLYQEVALGFGGYKGLKSTGTRLKVLQLNEVVTVFAAVAFLDDLTSNGKNFYEAMVEVRKNTLYTNHTLVQAAEAEFTLDQFERFVFPNIRSKSVLRFIKTLFVEGKIKLSGLALELAGKYNGVSRLHSRVADYYNIAGEKVSFKAITNGIDLKKWVMPETLAYYQAVGILGADLTVTRENLAAKPKLKSEKIRALKSRGREVMNRALQGRPDQNGEILNFKNDDFVFVFKRRLVDYKRPELPFQDPERLRRVLEPRGAHYIIAGRVHTGDVAMMNKLEQILVATKNDDYLCSHVHYLADYDEELAFGLSCGCNATINVPLVGLEACGTSWMKDVANLNVLISTIDGGVADADSKYCLAVAGESPIDELDRLYKNMAEAIKFWANDFELEYTTNNQLEGYLQIISGQRMLREYLDFAAQV